MKGGESPPRIHGREAEMDAFAANVRRAGARGLLETCNLVTATVWHPADNSLAVILILVPSILG
jgi:hypothetical protein